jgi:Methyltransferase domain
LVTGLSKQAAEAWTYTNGGIPRRVKMMGVWVLMRVEETLTDVYFRSRGLQTTGIDLDLNGAGSELMGYVPIRWRSLRGLFRNCQVTSSDVLLDYGSGKGRTVTWAAANYRFRRIIGVELDARLHASAQANVAHWKGRRLCENIDLICADATEYDVPDDVTIVYLFNPFLGSIFEKVLGKIQESLDRNPRELVILYGHPRMHDSLVNAGFTREAQEVAQPNDWAVYRRPKA